MDKIAAIFSKHGAKKSDLSSQTQEELDALNEYIKRYDVAVDEYNASNTGDSDTDQTLDDMEKHIDENEDALVAKIDSELTENARVAAEEKEKSDNARIAQEEEDKRKQEEADVETQRLAQEAKDKEAAAVATQKAAEEKAAQAPDAEKLVAFALAFQEIPFPVAVTEAGKAIFEAVSTERFRFAQWIASNATKL